MSWYANTRVSLTIAIALSKATAELSECLLVGRRRARFVHCLRRGRQHTVEVLAVVIMLRRLHKHFCDVAAIRATWGLKQIQRNAHVIGPAQSQEFQRECIRESLSATRLTLAPGSIGGFKNGCRGA